MILIFEDNDIWAKDSPEDEMRYLVLDPQARTYLIRLRDQMQAQKWRDQLAEQENNDA